jgi:type I restriction-modification system DNA methylase subunit/predicted type IV restriction endonuclease
VGAPQIILDLVQRFGDNIAAYKAGQYNETQVRHEFIDPFFEALGWDINNKQGFAEAYKDVIHEDSIKIGGVTKAPDYSFRIGGARKFFVEAKKPAVYIKEDIQPAFQLRRYAWSAKLPVSILTDFEEFAVYDCRKKPIKTDKASNARIIYFTFLDYAEKWDELAGIFSREAILKGAFDKFVSSNKAKGTAEVDEEFLREIEGWRETLARNIALRNHLSAREINFAVQKIIDRIIFLRIAEDRGIEIYGQLQALGNGHNSYKRLVEIFYKADDRYNSGIFHFQNEKGEAEAPDILTPKITLDDQVLKDIINGLYYPESAYEFSVLPADILGQVYEQFLGKVIRLTSENRVKIEEKPEVKKAGGVFYTPTFIVEYIVKTTVGRLIKGKTPKQIEKIKVLDPACGSGSFLIGAYQCLLDYHLQWYVKDDPKKWMKGKNPALYQGSMGDWRLTTSEKKKILLNNIFGVDIDSQAVEVTKLSLLLKVLEGENEHSINRQLKLFHVRALPDLGNNVKCGNSLVGPDFYENGQALITDEESRYRINVFEYQQEFSEVFKQGGFDMVIGNPPYVRQELLQELKPYYQKRYEAFAGTADLYIYFFEKGINLLREKGVFSVIVANKWMRAAYGEPLRKWLKKQRLEEITDFGDLKVFQRATTYPCIIRIAKDKPYKEFVAAEVKTLDFNDLEEHLQGIRFAAKLEDLKDDGWSLAEKGKQMLLDKLRKVGKPLGEFVCGNIFYGVKTGLNKAFVIDEETRAKLIAENSNSAEIIKPFLAGRDVRRYQPLPIGRFLIFTKRGIDIAKYPAIERYLNQFREELMPKPLDWKNKEWKGRKVGSYKWFEIQDAVDYWEEFEKPKIIVPCIVKQGSYVYDSKRFFSNDKTCIIPTKDLYLLGLLNSKTLDFVLHSIASTKQGGYFEYKPMYISQLPIYQVKTKDKNGKEIKEKITISVEAVLKLNEQFAIAKMEQDKAMIHRQINTIERQIDSLVYRLYGLTEDEIKLVEGSENILPAERPKKSSLKV